MSEPYRSKAEREIRELWDRIWAPIRKLEERIDQLRGELLGQGVVPEEDLERVVRELLEALGKLADLAPKHPLLDDYVQPWWAPTTPEPGGRPRSGTPQKVGDDILIPWWAEEEGEDDPKLDRAKPLDDPGIDPWDSISPRTGKEPLDEDDPKLARGTPNPMNDFDTTGAVEGGPRGVRLIGPGTASYDPEGSYSSGSGRPGGVRNPRGPLGFGLDPEGFDERFATEKHRKRGLRLPAGLLPNPDSDEDPIDPAVLPLGHQSTASTLRGNIAGAVGRKP